jgi:hypothetical protein
MTRVSSPVPLSSSSNWELCPAAGRIESRVLGLRRDRFWLAWDIVTDEWAKMLTADGASPMLWRAPVGKGDDAAAEGGHDYATFLASIDIAITGLCNCGGCTTWAIRDTVGALEKGIPTVVVCTEHFVTLARSLAAQRGHRELRIEVLPFPLEGRPEEEVRQVARAHYDSMLSALGAVR